MKLSKLVYLAVKNVVLLQNEGFTYESFIKGDYDSDLDYATNINNVFIPLNKAIHRLSDRDKLPTKVYVLPIQKNNEYDLSEIKDDLNVIKNVYEYNSNCGYSNVEYRQINRNKLLILDNTENKQYYVEYVQDIPHFDRGDWAYYEETDEIEDVDLKDYGITDTMCSYIIEYIKGNLYEVIDPSMATIYLNRAEEYMADLKDYQIYFNQRKVKNVFKV